MIRDTKKFLYTSLVAATLLSTLSFVHAKTDTLSEGSLSISPFLIEQNIKPGESKFGSITVSNLTNSSLPIAISINDFVPTGSSGSVRFLESSESSHNSFSLASWITIINQPELTIPPYGKTIVDYSIQVPLEAEPGTHYGGLLFSSRSHDTSIAGSKIIRKVGALILLATGKTNPSGSINNFVTSKQIYTNPVVNFTSEFANTGNVHLAPKGQVAVKNVFGRLVGETYFNPNGQFVLPQSPRTFTAEFTKLWMFGRYTAELTYYFGNPKLEARKILTFWVFPIKFMIIGLGIILLLWIVISAYNKFIINKFGK